MQKIVSISIDENLNRRWGQVAKKIAMTKSGIVEDFLRQILPILEQKTPQDMVTSALHEFEALKNVVEDTKSLFDEIEEKKIEEKKAV
jgi:antitoxin component of RelBE/YafQ-DinJ toxin-antitoxin module